LLPLPAKHRHRSSPWPIPANSISNGSAMNKCSLPAVFMVDAEIICVDQGQDRISLILSGKKRDLSADLNGKSTAAHADGATSPNVKDAIERIEFVEQRKREIEDTIEKLQQLYLTLSE
jgi:hypothetical protein